MGDLDQQLRRERRLWLAGTALMAVAPVRFAAIALSTPAAADQVMENRSHGAVLQAPEAVVQLLGPIDQALQTSGLTVLPALVVLFFLLRVWFGYGRRLFKPVAAR
jgi:hypothetical protein